MDPSVAAAAGGPVLGAELYGLAAAAVELLATLAAHGAAAELRAVGLDGVGDIAASAAGGGRDGGVDGDAGGNRWVKEIAIGVGGSNGGGGGGKGVDVLEAFWSVARDIDGVQGELCGGGVSGVPLSSPGGRVVCRRLA